MRKTMSKKSIYALIILGLNLVMLGCSTVTTKGRVWLDSSTHKDSPPDWVTKSKMAWEDDGKVFLKANHTVRGDERVNGACDLAKLNAKENLLSEIADEVKGTLDNYVGSINEQAETVLGKARSSEFKGKITGLRFTEEYFERYKIGDVERVDCHTLSEISKADYNSVKRSVIEKVQEADARIKEAIVQKHIDFFKPSNDPKKSE